MSQPDYSDTEKGDNAADGQPRSSSEPLQGGFNPWPIFSIYSKMAEEDDNKLAERWQKDADCILVFTGLFSGVIATFLAVSVQDLRPNSQDTSAFYLGKIYQRLEESNVFNSSTPSNLASPPPFSPSKSALWVNSLWFLSLTMSLSCAVMATLLQQWGRRYLKITQPSASSPERRARMRALFAGSTDRLLIKVLNAALPCYLHLSLFLFFIGLLVFVFQINPIVFYPIMWWIALSTLIYVFFTILPLFHSDGLLCTPVSSLFGVFIAFIFYFALTISGDRFSFQIWKRYGDILERDFERPFGDLLKADDKHISKWEPEIDVRVLKWTIDALGEDSTLEKFFEAVPGFFNPRLGKDILGSIPHRIEEALSGFLDRTFSPDTVSESVRDSRLVICLNAARAACKPQVPRLLQVILEGRWSEALQSVNLGQYLRRPSWSNSDDKKIGLLAQSLIARIVMSVRERDDRWIALVRDEFGMAGDDYVAHGDSLSLAILIHITRRRRATPWDPSIWTPSSFDIRHTLPEVQQDFCTLWNELVHEAHEGGQHTSSMILKNIRRCYITLHKDTDASFPASTADGEPSSYPLCHVQHTTPQMHTGQMGEPSRAPIAASLTLSNRNPDLVPDRDISLPDPRQSVAAAASLSRPLESNQQSNISAPLVAPHISEITANPISATVPSTRDASLQRNKEPSVVPPIVTDFQPTGSHISHPLGPPSSPTVATRSHIALSIVEAQVTTNVGALHAHDETRDPPDGGTRHAHQSVPLSAPDIDERAGYGQHGQNWL